MNQDGTHNPTAYWYRAEQILLNSTESDVLAILDCCYAGNAVKDYTKQYEAPRLYELIAASSKDFTTPAPGEKSFTSHLIASLRELLGEHMGGSFTTATLAATINEKYIMAHQEPSVPVLLHNRLSNFSGRRIQLARQGNEVAEPKQPVEAAHLKLMFSL